MSTLPTQTRSLRPPTDTKRTGISVSTRSSARESNRQLSTDEIAKPARAPPSRSPSRLPVKPPTSTRSNVVPARKTSVSRHPPLTEPRGTSLVARPGSSNTERSTTARARLEPRTTTTTVSKPPLTTTRRPRAGSNAAAPTTPTAATRHGGHTRNKSATTLTASTTLRPPSTSTHTATAPTSAAVLPSDRPRPQFSTFQQHYSPAKSLAPKPTTASLLAPPSPSKQPANIAASALTARLHAELLQLHLLHRDAAPTLHAWHASARAHLADRWSRLGTQHARVAAREAAVRAARNAQALRAWDADGGLEDRIRALDEVLAGAWSAGEPGGRYARVVRRFERWVDGAQELQALRARHDAGGDDDDDDDDATMAFVDGLDAAWHAGCDTLARKLLRWDEQLAALGTLGAASPPSPPETAERSSAIAQSSLAVVLATTGALVRGMREELAAMQRIEQQVMAREDAWVQAQIAAVDEVDDGEVAGAIWRRV